MSRLNKTIARKCYSLNVNCTKGDLLPPIHLTAPFSLETCTQSCASLFPGIFIKSFVITVQTYVVVISKSMQDNCKCLLMKTKVTSFMLRGIMGYELGSFFYLHPYRRLFTSFVQTDPNLWFQILD